MWEAIFVSVVAGCISFIESSADNSTTTTASTTKASGGVPPWVVVLVVLLALAGVGLIGFGIYLRWKEVETKRRKDAASKLTSTVGHVGMKEKRHGKLGKDSGTDDAKTEEFKAENDKAILSKDPGLNTAASVGFNSQFDCHQITEMDEARGGVASLGIK